MRSTEVSMLPEADCHDLSEVDFGLGRTVQGNFVTTGPSADFRKQVKKQLMAHPHMLKLRPAWRSRMSYTPVVGSLGSSFPVPDAQ